MMECGNKVAIIGVEGQPRRMTRSTKRSTDGQQVVICYTPDVALILLLPAALTGTAGLFCF